MDPRTPIATWQKISKSRDKEQSELRRNCDAFVTAPHKLPQTDDLGSTPCRAHASAQNCTGSPTVPVLATWKALQLLVLKTSSQQKLLDAKDAAPCYHHRTYNFQG